jgi:HCOMODA/2-hydroxy-3-carboxy-muconic semialdehyde decarboxylase
MSCTRRRVLEGAAALAALAGLRSPLAQEGAPQELQKLVAANRILANEGVVDAFGHVSVRDPRNAQRFWLSRSRSPALVELADLMEFDLEGAAVDARGRTPYGERVIHAAVYAARGDVQSVVHHHAYGVLPFAVSDEPLRPVVHTASVIGAEIPVWDIRTRFGDTDMLVRSMEQGRDLAAALAGNTCALIRGHGAVVVGASIERAVLTAIYLEVNANVLLQALSLGAPAALSAGEIARSTEAQFSPLALDRSWEYFCQRAGVDPK